MFWGLVSSSAAEGAGAQNVSFSLYLINFVIAVILPTLLVPSHQHCELFDIGPTSGIMMADKVFKPLPAIDAIYVQDIAAEGCKKCRVKVLFDTKFPI